MEIKKECYDDSEHQMKSINRQDLKENGLYLGVNNWDNEEPYVETFPFELKDGEICRAGVGKWWETPEHIWQDRDGYQEFFKLD